MRLPVLTILIALAMSGAALAVSIGEMARDCGDDAKVYCDGVGYGDAMQQCLEQHRAQLTPACQAIVDRLAGGEGVSLF